MYLLCYHFTKCSSEETGQSHLPLHQVTHQHHQVLAKALELNEVALGVLDLVTMLFDAAVDFSEERVADFVDALYKLAAMFLFGNAEFVIDGSDVVGLLEDSQVRKSAKIIYAKMVLLF